MNEPRKPRPIREPLRQRLPRIGAMVVALVVATAAMVLARQCSHRGDSPFRSGLPAKSGGDTLDVAIEISPLSYSLARDTISGLDYDILRAFSVQTRRPVKFHPFAPMDYALDGLRAGVFDVVVSSLPSTSSLKQELLLTDRVYLDRQVLVQRRHDPHFIREAHALAGDSVWIAAGSPLRDRIRNLSREIGDTIYIMSDHPYTSEHLVMLVAAGEIPRAVVNEGLARRLAAADTLLDLSTPVSFTQFQTWAVAPSDTALRRTLNAFLASFRNTPRYRALLDRYLQ